MSSILSDPLAGFLRTGYKIADLSEVIRVLCRDIYSATYWTQHKRRVDHFSTTFARESLTPSRERAIVASTS